MNVKLKKKKQKKRNKTAKFLEKNLYSLYYSKKLKIKNYRFLLARKKVVNYLKKIKEL